MFARFPKVVVAAVIEKRFAKLAFAVPVELRIFSFRDGQNRRVVILLFGRRRVWQIMREPVPERRAPFESLDRFSVRTYENRIRRNTVKLVEIAFFGVRRRLADDRLPRNFVLPFELLPDFRFVVRIADDLKSGFPILRVKLFL